jgi:hypothetical protein
MAGTSGSFKQDLITQICMIALEVYPLHSEEMKRLRRKLHRMTADELLPRLQEMKPIREEIIESWKDLPA